jgi:hypothetical protein
LSGANDIKGEKEKVLLQRRKALSSRSFLTFFRLSKALLNYIYSIEGILFYIFSKHQNHISIWCWFRCNCLISRIFIEVYPRTIAFTFRHPIKWVFLSINFFGPSSKNFAPKNTNHNVLDVKYRLAIYDINKVCRI